MLHPAQQVHHAECQREAQDGVELVHVAQRGQRPVEQLLQRQGEQPVDRTDVPHRDECDAGEDPEDQEGAVRQAAQAQPDQPQRREQHRFHDEGRGA